MQEGSSTEETRDKFGKYDITAFGGLVSLEVFLKLNSIAGKRKGFWGKEERNTSFFLSVLATPQVT